LNKKRKTFLKDKSFLSLDEFKRSVTLALLLYGMNAEKCRKEDTREVQVMVVIQILAEPGAKRRKDRLGVPDEIHISQAGIYHSIFVEKKQHMLTNLRHIFVLIFSK
jgi:hypothetical protein